MDLETVRACQQASLDGSMAFPEIFGKLMTAGVERYTVDLVALEHRDYGRDGTIHAAPMPLTDLPPVAATLDAAAVQVAIHESQQGRLAYPEFVRRAMSAGVAAYTAFLDGRCVVYTGRLGDSHLEPFPSALPTE